MIRETAHALAACIVTFVLCAVVYPLMVWGAGQSLFPHQAEGSLIYGRDRTVIGSELIAQPFASEKYFTPRPSAVDYKADAAGGSNLGPKNPDLRAKIKERAEALKATDANPAPVDLVTASGAGLDPHISPEAAYYQASRVAGARGLPVEQVRGLIDRLTERSGAIIGAPPRVNVLKLNLALDEEKPAPAPAAGGNETNATNASPADRGDSTRARAAGDAPAKADGELTTTQTPLDEVAAQFARIREQLSKHTDALERSNETNARIEAEYGQIQARLKGLEDRIVGLADGPRRVSQLSDRIVVLDERVGAVGSDLAGLRKDVQAVRDGLKPTDRPAPDAPARTAVGANLVADSGFNSALETLRQGRFAEAEAAFRAMTRANPDDARAWYLAAVSRGLATKEWVGETLTLVEKGVEREKAGTPGSTAISSALNSLTPTTGRDWLAYYRGRISTP